MSNSLKENKMGVMPVHRLLLSMALPMVISMLVQALYNIVDSVFVAQLPGEQGEAALAAVSISFPIQNLMIAVGSGTGVGINALLSRSLGEKNFDEASRAANNGIFLAVLSYLLFLLFGLFGVSAFISTQTPDATVASMANDYLSLCCMLSFGLFGQFVFERLLQSTGKTLFTMITQATGAVINICLDPIFIFGMFGVPKMGVAGAAVATVFGQITAMIMAIIFNLKKNKEIRISLSRFRPNPRTIGRIYAVGLPSIAMASIGSVMNSCFNIILGNLGSKIAADAVAAGQAAVVDATTGVTVFGVYFKLQSFIFMPVFGLNNGMVPIVAYNYGAGKRDRIIKVIRLSITYAVGMMLVGLAVFQLFPELLLSAFNPSEGTLLIGVPALRTISLSFTFAGFCIIITSVFQALSRGVISLMVSIGRQLVVLIPVAFLLSMTGEIDAVWWAFPIAEVMSLGLCIIFFIRIYKKEIKPLRPKES